MNIVFLSEQGLIGKISDDFDNMRTEYGWMKMFDAFHLPYMELRPDSNYVSVLDTADFFILIPSKKNPQFLNAAHILKNKNKKFAIMQEGPNYLWQDWPIDFQIIYLGIIKELADIVFVHNEKDKHYFEGITNKPVIVLKTLYDKYTFEPETITRTNSVIIGGNMCSWYGGMNSYLTIRSFNWDKIVFPSMGRKQEKEEEILKALDKRVEYLPYIPVKNFIEKLTEYKIAIHLMPTAAAGSFSLNCAIAGIPCIGNKDDDTQRILFPDLSIDVTDIKKAKELVKKLTEDKIFYEKVVTTALNNLKLFSIEENKNNYLKLIEDIYAN